jgi:hypothetical protein
LHVLPFHARRIVTDNFAQFEQLRAETQACPVRGVRMDCEGVWNLFGSNQVHPGVGGKVTVRAPDGNS